MNKQTRMQDKWSFKISLLSLSLFLTMAPAISPVLPSLYDKFPGVGRSGVETLLTVPNFGIVAGLVLSPFVINWLGQKATVLIGLLIGLIFGTVPMYMSAYSPILVSRFLLGFGIGLFNSLATSFIPQFYADDEQTLANMIGIQNVMGSLGNAFVSFALSYLLMISWHMAFSIYLLFILALILFTIFVPLPGIKATRMAKKAQHAASRPKEKQHLNKPVWLIVFLMFFIFIFYMPLTVQLPNLVVSEKLGTISTVSMINGITTLIAIPIGASYGFFYKHLHDKLFPLGFTIVGLAFLLLASAQNIPVLILASVINGFGFGLSIPYMYNWLDWAAPHNSVNLATTVVLIAVNIGCFLSPQLVDGVAKLFNLTGPRSILVLCAIVFFLIAIYALVHYVRVHSQSKHA